MAPWASWSSEESGLLGSEFFTDAPTDPRDRMAAHLNPDGVGRIHPDTGFLVGSRRLSTEFGAWIEAADEALERPSIDGPIPDPQAPCTG